MINYFRNHGEPSEALICEKGHRKIQRCPFFGLKGGEKLYAERKIILPGKPGTDPEVFRGPPAFEHYGREDFLRDRFKDCKTAFSVRRKPY